MMRIGQGYDSHRLIEGRPLILGGVDIEFEMGLDGNSDADVLCHAIMDAMLGAVSAGDIGQHFPDDVRWSGAWSLELMNTVAGIVRDKGASVINIDSTIIAEAPKLNKYIPSMCSNIANAVGISSDCVSVKATTAEQMGSLGRKEGMAAMAVVLVEMEK
jgi:2-C-methyl-D-erythritol 2,4-cyclodiphosphate synthase